MSFHPSALPGAVCVMDAQAEAARRGLNTSQTAVLDIVYDTSGAANHATQSNAAKQPILRHDGTRWIFDPDGVDDFMATAAIVNGGKAATAAFAGLRSPASAGEKMVEFADNGVSATDSSWSANTDSSGRIELAMYEAAHGYAVAIDGADLRGTWFRSAAVFDKAGATNADQITQYLNGTLPTPLYRAPSVMSGVIGTHSLYLFAGDAGNNFHWAGACTAVVVTNSALTAQQVGDLDAWLLDRINGVEVDPLPTPVISGVTTLGETSLRVAFSMHTEYADYEIERDGVTVATEVAGSPYDDTGLDPATEYTYRVRGRVVE
jgi:hypothetical protein